MKKQNQTINFIIQLFSTTLLVVFLTFIVLRVIPGDPIADILGDYANPKNILLYKNQLGLDLPIFIQFIHFLNQLAHFDLGTSISFHKPVSELIMSHFPSTFYLAIFATILANFIGISSAIICVYYNNKTLNKIAKTISLLILSLPSFWLGPLLVIAFALHWPWLPISSNESLSSIVLPSITLGLGMSAIIFQTAFVSLTECLQTDYLKLAQAKGNSEWMVLIKHALPNAAIPILTVTALQFGHLLAGAIVTETIFDWPGIGKLSYDAILSRDYFTVQGIVLVVSFVFIFINLLSDLIRKRLAPKEEQ